MAVESFGPQSATPGTEHTLAAPTTDAKRTLTVDVSALAGTESVEIRIKESAQSGGTVGVVKLATYYAGEPEPITKSPAFEFAYGATFTLKQIGGTGRSFPWRVVTL